LSGQRLPVLAAGLKQASTFRISVGFFNLKLMERVSVNIVTTPLLDRVTLSRMDRFLRHCHVDCMPIDGIWIGEWIY
jgi:hypothetical protein